MTKYDQAMNDRIIRLELFVQKVAEGYHPDEIPRSFLLEHVDDDGNMIGTLEDIQEAWGHYAIESSVDTLRELVDEARKMLVRSDVFHVYGKDGAYYDGRNGTRLTDCCAAYSTYMDDDLLSCKACFMPVPNGQGDGVEEMDVELMKSSLKKVIFSDA